MNSNEEFLAKYNLRAYIPTGCTPHRIYDQEIISWVPLADAANRATNTIQPMIWLKDDGECNSTLIRFSKRPPICEPCWCVHGMIIDTTEEHVTEDGWHDTAIQVIERGNRGYRVRRVRP